MLQIICQQIVLLAVCLNSPHVHASHVDSFAMQMVEGVIIARCTPTGRPPGAYPAGTRTPSISPMAPAFMSLQALIEPLR